MERQIPKNVRQIGNVSDTPKIYVEDYVDTFFSQLCEKVGEEPIGAFLVGDIQTIDEEEYVYVYGAIQMHDLKWEESEYVIDEDTWKKAYEDCKQYFEDGEMLGWFVAHPGVELNADNATIRLHKKSFPKKNTVFIMKDPAERDEVYYVHKFNDLMEMGGHYTYYEKNPCMQNYMISCRKKNGASPSETVEDRAAKDFRSLVRSREESRRQARAARMMYGVSACLVLIVVIMGVAMMNNFDKMKSVQSRLDNLSGTPLDTQNVEAKETSGNVTAVTQDGGQGSAAQDPDTQNPEIQDPNAQASPPQGEQEADPQEGQAENGPLAEGGASAGSEVQDGNGASAGSEEQNGDGASAGSAAEDGNGAQDGGTDTGGTDSGDAAAANMSAQETGMYVVEQGDTLAIISKKMYGDVSYVDAICRMNGLTDGNLIYIGQKLILP